MKTARRIRRAQLFLMPIHVPPCLTWSIRLISTQFSFQDTKLSRDRTAAKINLALSGLPQLWALLLGKNPDFPAAFTSDPHRLLERALTLPSMAITRLLLHGYHDTFTHRFNTRPGWCPGNVDTRPICALQVEAG